ncbi:unnamed protein product [Hymenolepis diminuta]|uniref:DUF5727 domain-containing protein n=1 Tax=Hymenolepis diminuta TaxID=6216 RepID=A0A564Y6Y9_HYMDI|nr:unnamed protein product [Hymenolepis diminuta]
MVNLRNRAILITSDASHIEMEKAHWFRHQEQNYLIVDKSDMMHNLAVLITLILSATRVSGYYTLTGDTRMVKGKVDEAFNYKTTLPGNYAYFISGIHNISLEHGDCSSPFFTCKYNLVDDTTMTVHMEGYMSWGLKWVTFFGADLVPISVVFFVDDIWNDLAGGSIQPQYSVPLIVSAKGLHTVSITSCSIFSTTAKLTLSLDRNNVMYYSTETKNLTDKRAEFPQLLNVEIRNILLHKVATVTIEKKHDIDFYSCKTGNYYITHTIDWTF